MPYKIIENTSEGLVIHNVENADIALSMWYALDGEVQVIKDEHQKEIALSDLIAEVAARGSRERQS